LDGAVALVASVSARVRIRLSPPRSDGSPGALAHSQEGVPFPAEAVLARRLAEEALGSVDGELSIDASELRKSGRKLGLGSSAAAAAGAVGVVFAAHGRDLDDPATQRQVFELALAGHKAVAPEGSGADVAAASLGGLVRFRVENGRLAEAERVDLPASLHTRVVWTGKEARTSEFVRAVRQYEARDGAGFSAIRARLFHESARFADAVARGDSAGVVMAAGAYGLEMGALGEAAGVSIVTPELAQIADLARAHGGSAKPSGAGGGDVALAFFTSESDALTFDTACRTAGLDLLDLGLGAPGVRIEAA
jgi:phosphomevalonate kinase